jgi:phosphoribosylamine--glycine ligase
MNVLILGSGGREHALAWKIKQSPHLKKLFVAPGNGGTRQIATNINIPTDDFFAVKEAVLKHHINLVVVGPEAPLVNGIRDFFEKDYELHSIPVFGPGQQGARLEGSKTFAKEFMYRHHIPTAAYQSFEDLNEAMRFLNALKPPFVLKADGLAAGKGVIICQDKTEAQRELTGMMAHKKFGEASSTVVIEQFLEGIELSVFVITDGKDYKILPEAKDYKRIGEHDTGLNTGGMGSISPVPFADKAFMENVERKIIKPTIEGLQKEDIPFTGFIFFGLMKTGDEPQVIEYNVRMGDPEAETVIPRIKSDLLELILAAVNGTLHEQELDIHPEHAAAVMMVSGGYPQKYEKGIPITGADSPSESIIFHAGTAIKNNHLVTSGGRVLAVTALGNSMNNAIKQAYADCEKIHFDKQYYRKDIGEDLK